MAVYVLTAAAVIFACVICNKVSSRLGIPMLLAFILLGMVFGSDGLVKISFNNYQYAEEICSFALIFIMFYGGFGTKWREARPVAGKAILLSSLGTVLTCLFVGVFCALVLKFTWLEGFLVGAVICSTDAASVFSVLRSKRLNLRYNTASLLEVESGSNDPFSYMLTVIILSLMDGDISGGQIAWMLFQQIAFGAAFGIAIAVLALMFMKKFKFASEGFDCIFIVAVALVAYAAPAVLNGNGYLSVYIAGIIMGNQKISNKQALVHFFDGTTGLMQMILFFLLGLLALPSQLPAVTLVALAIALFLTFVARPLAVTILLAPFKSNLRQILLVSWAGMRGAASIVFAIIAVLNPAVKDNKVFNIVFIIVLFSILLQGSLIPLVAKKLDMTDEDADVMKTFTDYTDEVPVQFIQFTINDTHPWVDHTVSEIQLPPDSLLVLMLRGDKKIIPKGKTVLHAGDTMILSGKATGRIDGIHLYEKRIGRNNENIGKKILEVSTGTNLIIMIKRNDKVVIPTGSTVLQEKDVLVINNTELL